MPKESTYASNTNAFLCRFGWYGNSLYCLQCLDFNSWAQTGEEVGEALLSQLPGIEILFLMFFVGRCLIVKITIITVLEKLFIWLECLLSKGSQSIHSTRAGKQSLVQHMVNLWTHCFRKLSATIAAFTDTDQNNKEHLNFKKLQTLLNLYMRCCRWSRR